MRRRAFRARYKSTRVSPIWLLPASGLIQDLVQPINTKFRNHDCKSFIILITDKSSRISNTLHTYVATEQERT